MSRADGHEIVVAVRTITSSASDLNQEELLDALKAISLGIDEPYEKVCKLNYLLGWVPLNGLSLTLLAVMVLFSVA